jgi:hypothetical protein
MSTPNLGFQNFFTTTLASGITASDTTIYLNSLPTPSEGYLVIEPDNSSNKEIIYYTSKGANFVTLPSVGAGRGVGGTTAVSHSSGVTCQMNVVAEHFEALQDGTAFAVGGIGASAYADGWAPILGSTPNTVTYNGNRNYDLVFNSVDLSSTISPGQKLKLTRTVAAPTKCTDLESTSSQYYSKTSPAGLTFTTTFTCMAWVKLESYPASAMGIIARRNVDTEGFSLEVDSSGRVTIVGLRIASNNKQIRSYASLPLNKWVHVAATLDMSAGDTSVQKIWFDGVEVSREYTLTGTATALVQGTTALVVGAQKSAGTNPFDGKIAQAAIFSSQLTEANVRAYQSQGLTGSESNLVSAYSFNNSINDLNTTNANNLTAQGSAVATDTDSPYANAVTAGTQEYAEINSVTFSTNTTVNVRVPDTSMIPTSGGVSNVYYAVGANPYGLPYFTKVLSQIIIATDQTSNSNSSNVDISGMVSTVYVPTNAQIKIRGEITAGTAIANALMSLRIYEGSTLIIDDAIQEATSTIRKQIITETIITPLVGSHTYKGVLYVNQNANTTIYGSGTVSGGPTRFTVELV